MARVSKLALLHPVRIQAIKVGLCTICDFCQHSMYRGGTDSLKQIERMKFERCLVDEVRTADNNCSLFVIDEGLIDEEERLFYEKSICRG